MLDSLIKINNELMKKYENDAVKLQNQMIISNILKQKNCFFKLPIEIAFNILKDLEIANYEEVYLNLISYSEYLNN